MDRALILLRFDNDLEGLALVMPLEVDALLVGNGVRHGAEGRPAILAVDAEAAGLQSGSLTMLVIDGMVHIGGRNDDGRAGLVAPTVRCADLHGTYPA